MNLHYFSSKEEQEAIKRLLAENTSSPFVERLYKSLVQTETPVTPPSQTNQSNQSVQSTQFSTNVEKQTPNSTQLIKDSIMEKVNITLPNRDNVEFNSDTLHDIDNIPVYEFPKRNIHIDPIVYKNKVNFIVREFSLRFTKCLKENQTSKSIELTHEVPSFTEKYKYDMTTVENLLAHAEASKRIREILIQKGYNNFTVEYSESTNIINGVLQYIPKYTYIIYLEA